MAYTPPLRDLQFVLEHLAPLEELAALPGFEHADAATVLDVLGEWGRFASDVLAPLDPVGDATPARVEGDRVVTPPGFAEAYRRYVEAGWGAVPFEPGYGGGGFPWLVGIAMQEVLNGANTAFGLCPLLTQGAIDMLEKWGSEEQRHLYLPRMVTGEWTGTMNLTEPDAGSDVGALRTRAVPAEDGTWRITGTKIFITYGEHDWSDNIVHLVLARVPDAPPGTKGISCFIVPKHLVGADGALGERNAVKVVSVEHKMGIHASPTCVMEYDGAVGHLIGEVNAGMTYMFTMMNTARLSVGVQGLGLADAAYQAAAAYARQRVQGRPLGAERGAAIVDHPDVRRMLLTMRSSVDALRALCYVEAFHLDIARHHPDPEVQAVSAELVELLTPMAKGWGTDLAVEITSTAVQVFGGMGYIEESGVARLYRDARITPIYEGTNGIQALDLVGRKLGLRGGAAFGGLLERIRTAAAELQGADDAEVAAIGAGLADALDVLDRAVKHLTASTEAGRTADVLAAATPFLRLCSTVVGGWLLGRQALAARAAIDAGTDVAFHTGKLVSARFYAAHVLPQVHGLLPTVLAGADELLALPAEAF